MASNPIFVTTRKPLKRISHSDAVDRISDRILELFYLLGDIEPGVRYREREIHFTLLTPLCVGFNFTEDGVGSMKLIGYLSNEGKMASAWKMIPGMPFGISTGAPMSPVPLSTAGTIYQDDQAMGVIVNDLFVRAVSVRP